MGMGFLFFFALSFSLGYNSPVVLLVLKFLLRFYLSFSYAFLLASLLVLFLDFLRDVFSLALSQYCGIYWSDRLLGWPHFPQCAPLWCFWSRKLTNLDFVSKVLPAENVWADRLGKDRGSVCFLISPMFSFSSSSGWPWPLWLLLFLGCWPLG